jgi:RNA polymerase sigma-70 factor (ECF subfamily)
MGRLSQISPSRLGGDRSRFATTHWSLVRAAGATTCDEARQALSALCAQYWYPIYAFARRRGLPPDKAADVTQGFFATLIEQKVVRAADPSRGKFRSYLLGAFKHYLSHEWARARARKRGGGRKLIPLDPHAAETRYGIEPAHDVTAERLFERQWALRLLELALEDLAQQCERDGKRRQFELFKPFLSGGTCTAYREAGAELGLSEGAARVLVHRLRARYRQLLREHIRRTVGSADQVEEEIQELFSAVGA